MEPKIRPSSVLIFNTPSLHEFLDSPDRPFAVKSNLGPLVQESLITGSTGRGRVRLREIQSGAGTDTFYPVLFHGPAND